MEKVRNVGYVEFKELLADNVALVQRIQELGVPNGNQQLLSSHRLRDSGSFHLGAMLPALSSSQGGWPRMAFLS